MRYAHVIFIGALLSGIAYLGSSVIQWLSYGVTEGTPTWNALWGAFVGWSLISFLIVTIPPMYYRLKRRDEFRRFFFLQMGSVFIFIPIWLMVSMEITGVKSWVHILTFGIGGIPFTGPGGTITTMNIDPLLSIIILFGFLVLGSVMIRPRFIEKYETPPPRKPKTIKVTAELEPTDEPTEEIDAEMPEISRPVPDATSVDELRSLLAAIEISASIIERLITAGYATTTDLVSAKPEHIAQAASIDIRDAETLLLAIQREVWFGGI